MKRKCKNWWARQEAPRRRCLVYMLGVAALWALAALLGRVMNPGSRVLARLCNSLLARVSRLFPFALSEWAIIAAAVALVALPAVGAARRGRRGLATGLCRSLALLLTVGACFTLFWGVNYNAEPLAAELHLNVHPRSVEDLYAVTQKLMDQANELAARVPRDGEGTCLTAGLDVLTRRINRQYHVLGETYPLYESAVDRRPKQALLFGGAMPWVGIAGYYFPFTAEPVIGPTVPTHLAYNIAHELAHSLGVAPEDEAGFSAYLACITADDPELQYSAAINGYIYASNALYDQSPELAAAISSQAGEALRHDIRALNAYLSQFEGPVKEAGDKINDTYLKAQNQPTGVSSYGDMVDLLIAYTLQNIE